jgi:diguanylate cyclase (GGDEF)-like protein
MDDPALIARMGMITSQFLEDLPNEGEQREQTLLERALRYAAEIEQQMAAQRDRIAELENLSYTDPLTALLNRRGFESQLQMALARARRYGETGVIAYCDLDNLKGVNDGFGHTAGDDLVKCAAHTLRNSVREIDTVGRLGGDEFGVLLVNTSWKDGVRRMRTLQWLLDNAATDIVGTEIPLKVSIGFEPYGPQDTVDDLIHRADMAMYYNKRLRQAGLVRSAAE